MLIKNNFHESEVPAAPAAGSVIHRADGSTEHVSGPVIAEHFIEISVNGRLVARLTCTPRDLTGLVLGRLLTEGIIDGTEDVRRIFICGRGDIAEVELSREAEFDDALFAEPTCCTGSRQFLTKKGGRSLERLGGKAVRGGVDPSAVFELAGRFAEDSRLHASTGGTHSCILRAPDGSIHRYEDVSRHNALDKAVGCMLLQDYEPSGCMLFTSGRVAADMAVKAIASGIPVLISKAVPTDEALRLARDHGLTLIARAWPDSYVTYES